MVRPAAASTKRAGGCHAVNGTTIAAAIWPARNIPVNRINSRRLRAASTRLARNRICAAPPKARRLPPPASVTAVSRAVGGRKRSVARGNEISNKELKVTARIQVKGQPGKMTLSAAQSLLYVVEDQSDTIDIIGTANNAILETIPV